MIERLLVITISLMHGQSSSVLSTKNQALNSLNYPTGPLECARLVVSDDHVSIHFFYLACYEDLSSSGRHYSFYFHCDIYETKTLQVYSYFQHRS